MNLYSVTSHLFTAEKKQNNKNVLHRYIARQGAQTRFWKIICPLCFGISSEVENTNMIKLSKSNIMNIMKNEYIFDNYE